MLVGSQQEMPPSQRVTVPINLQGVPGICVNVWFLASVGPGAPSLPNAVFPKMLQAPTLFSAWKPACS